MRTTGGPSRASITVAPAPIRAAGSRARRVTMRPVPSSRTGAGRIGAAEQPSAAAELRRKGSDQALAALHVREPALPQDALHGFQRGDRYPVGADERQRRERNFGKHFGEGGGRHQFDATAVETDGLTARR